MYSLPLTTIALSNRVWARSKKKESRRRNSRWRGKPSSGPAKMTMAAMNEIMNSEEPQSTAMPMWIPSDELPSDEAIEANKSGAEPPNANIVTPEMLDDSLNVFEIY